MSGCGAGGVGNGVMVKGCGVSGGDNYVLNLTVMMVAHICDVPPPPELGTLSECMLCGLDLSKAVKNITRNTNYPSVVE